MLRRTHWLALIAACCIGGAGAYVLQARSRGAPVAPAALHTDAPVAIEDGSLLFRVVSEDANSGALAVSTPADPAAARLVPELRCERVHMAAGRGVCLTAERGFLTRYRAVPFDRRFAPGAALDLAGPPSRVQVAPDGRLAAMTVFVSGHSYASGSFSTRTSLLDLDTGGWHVEDLESFAVHRDGRPIQSPDFNFWGVTFARDGRTFYATLGTGGETLLVRGDADARRMEVVAEAVECPSLSPDGRRVAFKHRSEGVGAVAWRIWVLELETGQRHPLAEIRNVDDQVQWLDDAQVLYALTAAEGRSGSDQWVVPADGSGAPRLLLRGAYSAAVYRDGRR